MSTTIEKALTSGHKVRIDYQKTIYLSEEEEVCSGAVAEA